MGLVHLHFGVYVPVDHLQLRGCAARNVLLPSSIWIFNLTAGSLNHINGFICLLADVVGVVGVKWPLGILEDAVLHFDTEALIFLLVEFDQQLTGV